MGSLNSTVGCINLNLQRTLDISGGGSAGSAASVGSGVHGDKQLLNVLAVGVGDLTSVGVSHIVALQRVAQGLGGQAGGDLVAGFLILVQAAGGLLDNQGDLGVVSRGVTIAVQEQGAGGGAQCGLGGDRTGNVLTGGRSQRSRAGELLIAVGAGLVPDTIDVRIRRVLAVQNTVSLDNNFLTVGIQSLVGVVDVVISALELTVVLDEVGQGPSELPLMLASEGTETNT